MLAANQSYSCDTIPPARIAELSSRSPSRSPSPHPSTSTTFDIPAVTAEGEPEEDEVRERWGASVQEQEQEASTSTPPPLQPSQGRKLCIRHQRMADEGMNLQLQKALDDLPITERESINAIWSNFSSSSAPRRDLILRGILTMCCFSQLSLLTDELTHLIRIDPFALFPREVSLKVLGYLDAISLCRAAQVSRRWKSLADDDILWRGICEQHIGQKCRKCGWGLPVLERRRLLPVASVSPSPMPHVIAPSVSSKRKLIDNSSEPPRLKRQRSEATHPVFQHDHDHDHLPTTPLPVSHPLPRPPIPASTIEPARTPSPTIHSAALTDPSAVPTVTRPWKSVYSERLTVERNWRRGRCSMRILKGHTDGVMCLQFSETLQHPSFPILITGSYDRTARVWNLETGKEMMCLKGHTRAVRALQFDDAKLITGSMDRTVKVWNWRTGKCIRTLEGHTDGVVCLNFDGNVLASGSVDTTIKVWNFRTGECFTLRGHKDWVNSVLLWDSRGGDGVSPSSSSSSESVPSFDCAPSPCSGSSSSGSGSGAPCIDPGKMLFSASDDGTIRLWDLNLRTCVRQYTGHMGQVQSLRLLDMGCDDSEGSSSTVSSSTVKAAVPPSHPGYEAIKKPMIVSGSLDNTIRIWDVESGKTTKTLFGHIEGVWTVASDRMRLVSGSHDRTIKVWSREDGKCVTTLVGHMGAVTCLALGEDKIVSGSDDGDVRVWSFTG
ncbi:WD40 repeat-like protein [Stereum hirsutum FP-91666 SS1]|uniref:WD40 repeat-like protein n=1 Tax=Stereum hirsutum (strain FP-91666) TaxID=721885 RepID=UPI000440A1A7|nr:WD40 repeat-like protein [Stereum hirsutum FP-91666 SS1]EIM90473.1 WD40 repeat-like protein [Stereum hirsutum FP-91666 SS1]